MDKNKMRAREMYVALKVMGFRPTFRYGFYTFTIGDISEQVEFKPMVKKEHAFMLLDKLSEWGYDYSIQHTGEQVNEDNLFEQEGYTLYMKNRNNNRQQALVAKDKSLYECIMKCALQAAGAEMSK